MPYTKAELKACDRNTLERINDAEVDYFASHNQPCLLYLVEEWTGNVIYNTYKVNACLDIGSNSKNIS